MKLDTIYNEDCLKTLSKMSDNTLDLIVTSPPYNVDLGNNKYNKNPYDLYNDNKDHYEYIEWLRSIFTECYKKMKSGGRVCINIGNQKNGAVPVVSDVMQFMKEIGFIPMSQIVWDKQQTSNRTAWGSWMSPSCPSFPTPVEYILVFAKDNKKLIGRGETDLTKKEFTDWAFGLWHFKPEVKQKKLGHPAMFPVELPTRCIKMFSWIDAVVYDPFCGLGTTCYAAKKLKRRYIGSEISKDYCCKAKNRIMEVVTGEPCGE